MKNINRYFESKIINEKRLTPEWLYRIVGQNNLHDLRHIGIDMLHCKIEHILNQSCFYYCSGSDITPIVAFEGYVHSFIYSDNCVYQNYDKALFQLKDKLQKKEFEEIQKVNIDLDFFRLHKSDLAKIILPKGRHIYKPIPSGEFSIWKKGNSYFSLLYLCWDDICVWRNLYEREQIYPIAICRWQPENSNMYNEDNFIVWNENNLPQYIIGHAYNLETNHYDELGKVEYFGGYSVDKTRSIPLYEKRANR
jgi:hypothetical protein